MGEASTQKRRAEKVNRLTIKMRSSEDDHIFFQCLFESYKSSCQLIDVADIRVDAKSEVELLAEIKKIAVITRSNLVNVVSLMSAAQEHGEHPCIKGKSTQYLSLPVPIFFHFVFSVKNLIWPPDPLNKGKMDFLLHF